MTAVLRTLIDRTPSPERPRGFLQSGDRMGRREFQRLYEASPELKHVELIEGIVYCMASPIHFEDHGREQALLLGLLWLYEATHPEVEVAGPSTLLLDDENEPEPDVLLLLKPAHGGRATVVDKYVVGAPELVIEIAGSSKAIDFGDKLRAYERNGVREYVVWDTSIDVIHWFTLVDGRFERRRADPTGIFESAVFPGLRLDVAAALRRDVAGLVAAMRPTPEANPGPASR